MADQAGDWLRIRSYLVAHRHELGVAAADLYPGSPKAFGTPLLTSASWMPTSPVPLTDVELDFHPDSRPDEAPRSYSTTMAALAPPAVFENRPTYRLLEADLTGTPRLVFGRGWYFDSLDVGEAAAHEYAAAALHGTGQPRRTAVGDPCDLTRRPTNLAISTLVLCVDGPGRATMLLHRRDPAKVGHAGGLIQVAPVGVFQPISPDSEADDFSLWRSILRECAEELLGEPEPTTSVDYDTWPFAVALTEALNQGDAGAYVLGLGVDPLTFATDLLTVLTIPRPLFTTLFGELAAENDEGHLIAHVPFTQDTVNHYTGHEPMQAAGAALLHAASAKVDKLITRFGDGLNRFSATKSS